MLQRVDGFWIEGSSNFFLNHKFTHGPLPPGTNVYATIVLSSYNNLIEPRFPDPTGAAVAFIESWTVYNSDGTLSSPINGNGFHQNAVSVQNCATIDFVLLTERASAIAQINAFEF